MQNLKSDLLPTTKEASWSFLELTSRQPANTRTGEGNHIDSKEPINLKRFHLRNNTQLSESYLNSDKQKVRTSKFNPVNPACTGYSQHEVRNDRQKTLPDSFPQNDLFEVDRPIRSLPITTLEIEAEKRAEERTQRRLSRYSHHSSTNLDTDWVLKPATAKQVISQRKDSSVFANDGQMPRRSTSKNSASL